MINRQTLRPFNSPLATLLWKEWEEHKWKLLALISIIMSVYLAMLSESITELPQDASHVIFSLNVSLFAYTMFAPLFVSMSVCAAERSNRSIEFVCAQPVSLRDAAKARFVVGMLIILLPILCCFVCSIVLVSIWPSSSHIAPRVIGIPSTWDTPYTVTAISAMAMGASINAFAWICIAAVNQRTEFRAGLVGLIVVVVLLFVGSVGLAGCRIRSAEVSTPYLVALISTPIAYMGILDLVRHTRQELIFFTLVWQAALTLKLANVVVRRYGGDEWFAGWFDRVDHRERPSAALGRPRGTPWRALFWLQMRQTNPVGFVGLGIVVLTSFVVDPFYNPLGVCGFVGSILALIVGVGSFVHELDPKLYNFWSSRPISPSGWFWLKFAAGFCVLVLMFDVPYFILAWAKLIYPWSHYRLELRPPGDAPSLIAALFPVLLHLLVYSLGVLAACAIRHTVYSTIFAVCAVLAIVMLPEVAWADLPQWLSITELWTASLRAPHQNLAYLPFLAAAGLVAAIALPSTILAHALIKRDIALNT